jgi:hypothetical protein
MIGLMVSALAGCSKQSTLDTVPVTGIVTLDGQPVPGAKVVFAPSGGTGQAASGVTGSDGRYKLTTQEPNDGAMAGKYSVMISKTEGSLAAVDQAVKPNMTAEEATKAATEARDAAKEAEPTFKDMLPEKYKTAAGGLTADVIKGGKDINFELSSK